MKNNYKTPKIDAVLLEDGWVRPGEAPVYVRKVNNEGEYKYYFTFPACYHGWIEYEEWLEKYPERLDSIKKSIKNFGVWGANTYVKEKDGLAAFLMLSSDFFYHLCNKESNEKKEHYEKLLQVFLKTNKKQI